MAKDVTLSFLFDLYGGLLSSRQQEIFNGYYNMDLSLSELAEDYAITRQGVLRNLQSATQKLQEIEEKLGLYAEYENTRKVLKEIRALAEGLPTPQGDTIVALTKSVLE